MPKVSTTTDYAERDASIVINSYTTVLRRPRVPHEVFATYWRDVHGPLCSRIPGLGWYVQNHLDREQDAHLWPVIDGISPFADYELDGGVEIGFASKADQDVFNAASHILFADEQNMFAATVAYALPDGSRTLVDRIADPIPNGDDGFDRIHVHFGAASDDADAFGTFMTDFAETLAADPAVLKLRLHLPDRYDNAAPAPPAPNVDHSVPAERALIAVVELAFETPLTRRAFFDSETFVATQAAQSAHIAYVQAFAVSGVYTYVRDTQLTTAGLRGSRPAQLIERLGANNQVTDDVRSLMRTGSV
ncbi:hypothetical protein HMP09_0810 [Sphingomonas sp. HMP9]|uniref:hypothetical protein n=1 Tax=Sphingomonas sp. HMP9 TaxID=1517554 RepID=UPI0015964B24|nr:hypothetical protein [Sphingomonas sp. HMP9]BCA61576.1 hypothetical protein HMP09_0810 [Sphingomonas sp. HMP9]